MKYRAIHPFGQKGFAMSSVLSLGLLALSANAQATESIAQATESIAQATIEQQLIIDDIVCEGNVTTECDFITKKYYQKPGEVLNPDEIADAKLRLGTLIQFKGINTRLAKGHQRGHVVVIFEVQEAHNIQYQIGGGYNVSKVSTDTPYCYTETPFYSSSYRSCNSTNGEVKGPAFSAGVTDFNFLGSGKQLSFGINGNKWSGGHTIEGSVEREGEDIFYSQRDFSVGGSNYNMSVEYYDPHLLNTDFYYFRARVNHVRGRNSNDASLAVDQQEPRGSSHASATPYQFELGRRFGSHSYFSVDIGGFYTDTDDTQGVGINYGWDSQDDSIFPTQGSVFNSSYRFERKHVDEPTIAFGYQKHFEIAENQILTLGNSSLYAAVDKLFVYDHQFSSDFSARYTNIHSADEFAGTYSGWFVEGMIGGSSKTDYSAGQIQYGLTAGYTYQSDSMIYRLSLGFHHQERN